MKIVFYQLIYKVLWSQSKENIKLYTKLKFVKEGVLRDKVWRDGKWWDSYIYSMILSDYQKKQSN